MYDKAIQVRPTDAILYANRAAVRLSLNLADAALEDANKAVELDKAYSKAYYRKGQAHNAKREYAAALQAFETGMQLDPSNKTFKVLAAKAKEAAAKAKVEEATKAAEPAVVKTPPPPPPASTASTTSSRTSAAPKKKASPTDAAATPKGGEDDDEEVKLKAEEMRGYKVLADGRKTTYFNNVLSEDAKRLIGDIAPKKIEVVPAADAGPPAQSAGAVAGSAWNSAGTFEEKNMTEWAKGRLHELLVDVSFPIPNVGGGAAFAVKKVKDLDGDAAVTFVRGKKKYLFDFVFTLEWEAILDCGLAKGTLQYPDVTPDNDDEYDTLLEVDQLTPPEARPLITSFVKSSGEGMQQVVRERLRQFMQDFQAF